MEPWGPIRLWGRKRGLSEQQQQQVEVTLGDIEKARDVLGDIAKRTPFDRSRLLSELSGADVWLKLENLQRTGSFKLRGAAARLAAISLEDRTPKRAIIAASAGNHGLGIAFAARAFGLRATVLVSAQTPEVKRAGIAAL